MVDLLETMSHCLKMFLVNAWICDSFVEYFVDCDENGSEILKLLDNKSLIRHYTYLFFNISKVLPRIKLGNDFI